MIHTFNYRMRDLVDQVDLPASAIRFYLKQGMLPEPQRPTPNSALYGEPHLAALFALKQIKALAPELPLAQLKRVMELVEQGVETEVALALHKSVAQGMTGPNIDIEPLNAISLAREAGVSNEVVNILVKFGILIPMAGETDTPFNRADIEVVKMITGFQNMSAAGLDRIARIAALLREASALEMELRNSASDGKTPEVAAVLSGQLQNWVNFWHTYQFSRLRLSEIAEQGLGNTTMPVSGDQL